MIHIGIDCGVKTGIAVWCSEDQAFKKIETTMIHKAFDVVNHYVRRQTECKVYVEDARLRKWFGNNSDAKKQGAGSVKRDAKIWEDFLKDIGANFEMKAPAKGLTKMNKDNFKILTGWGKLTSEHARDAALMVFKK